MGLLILFVVLISCVIASDILIFYNQERRIDLLQSRTKELEDQIESERQLLNHYQTTYQTNIQSYQRMKSEINMYTQHPSEGDKFFITPNDLSVIFKAQEITGGWSEKSSLEEYWTDIMRIFNWLESNIQYRNDGLYPVLPSDLSSHISLIKDMWQFPNQTLELKEGDCEDQALLLCSIIKAYSNLYHAELVSIIGSSSSHIAVQIFVPERTLVILDPSGTYYTHDTEGILYPKNVENEINNWIAYWNLSKNEDLSVNRVLSDEIDSRFTSTGEYLLWMGQRSS